MAIVVRVVLLLMLAGNVAVADDERARVNYMLHCQGCHLPQAQGFAGKVPPIKDFAGYFLHSTEGREFLIRVPGVATSALADDEISELMNWLISTYSAGQVPDEYLPFTADEVARLRQDPEPDPESTRTVILESIAANLPPLAEELAKENN